MSKKELFLDFQKQWPLERIQKMTLQEYSSIGNKNSFIYWIENKLDMMGSIWGGSSFKFGVYERDPKRHDKNISRKGLSFTDKYAWYTKYGNSVQEAFSVVKDHIISVIQAVLNKDLTIIDKIDLGDAYKWKIAFHYQDINNPFILAVFQRDALEEYIHKREKHISNLQYTIFKMKRIKTFQQCLDISADIWGKYVSNFSNTDRKKVSRKRRLEILHGEENARTEIRVLARSHNYELASYRKELDKYTCQNPKCSFQYKHKIIEAHHLIPLYTTDDVKITSIEELITLCPTCHRLAHRILTEDAKANGISENESKFTHRKDLLEALSQIYDSCKK